MAEDLNFATEDEEYAAAFAARARQETGGGAEDDGGMDQGGPDGGHDGDERHDGGQGDHGQNEHGQDEHEQGDGGRDDGGPEGQGAGNPDDLETLKKRAHSYDSLLGRHKDIQNENLLLRQELARLKQAPAPERMEDEDVPADLREDLEVIAGLDPELAELVRERSADGDRLRKSLVKFGPESTAAMAEALRTRRYVEVRRQAELQAQIVEGQKRHYDELLSAVPSLAGCSVVARNDHGQYQLFAHPEREADFNAYFKGLGEWLDELPHKTARAYAEIVWKSGGPREVADVLKEYDKARTPREHVDKELAENLGPVRSRSRGPAAGAGADPDSFEGAFRRRVQQERGRA